MARYHTGSVDSDEGCIVEDYMLMQVAKMIGNDWKHLARTIGLEEAVIQCIEIDEASYGSNQMAYKALLTWKRSQNYATKEHLIGFLLQLERKDIAAKLK